MWSDNKHDLTCCEKIFIAGAGAIGASVGIVAVKFGLVGNTAGGAISIVGGVLGAAVVYIASTNMSDKQDNKRNLARYEKMFIAAAGVTGGVITTIVAVKTGLVDTKAIGAITGFGGFLVSAAVAYCVITK